MKHFLTASVAALALVLMTGLGARADNVPPALLGWTYNFTTNPPTGAVFSDGGQSAGVTFTQTGPNDKSAVGSSDVVVSNLTIFSAAPPATPDKLTTSGAYTVGLTLKATDSTGLHTATLVFDHNKLSGFFSSASAGVTNSFGANSIPTDVHLGAYKFSVALTSYTPPGPPDQATNGSGSAAGSISAHITITTDPVTSDIVPSPEPGTMLLSGLGLSLLSGAAWRKRRQAQVGCTSFRLSRTPSSRGGKPALEPRPVSLIRETGRDPPQSPPLTCNEIGHQGHGRPSPRMPMLFFSKSVPDAAG